MHLLSHANILSANIGCTSAHQTTKLNGLPQFALKQNASLHVRNAHAKKIHARQGWKKTCTQAAKQGCGKHPPSLDELLLIRRRWRAKKFSRLVHNGAQRR